MKQGLKQIFVGIGTFFSSLVTMACDAFFTPTCVYGPPPTDLYGPPPMEKREPDYSESMLEKAAPASPEEETVTPPSDDPAEADSNESQAETAP